jgi:uncharacterized damage-inducible protein DinB
MTTEQALFLRDFLLQGIEGEFAATKQVLAAIPDKQSDYKPDPKSRTARELAWHIVTSEIAFFNDIARGSFEGSEQEAPNPTKSTAELVTYYETNFKAGVEKIRKLSGEQLAKTIPFFGVFNLPAAQYLSFLANHTIHHRGQLSAYLRPMGSKVPAIYGPSGDAMWEAGEGAGA